MKRAERHQLGAVIDDVRAWANTAQEVRQFAAHLPLSGAITLPDDDLALLVTIEQVASRGDISEAGRLAQPVWFEGRKKLQPAHASADRLTSLRQQYRLAGADQRLNRTRDELASRAEAERRELAQVLATLRTTRSRAAQEMHDAAHLTITRAGALTEAEATAAESIIQMVDEHSEAASRLLDPSTCSSGDCVALHASAKVLSAVHEEARATGISEHIQDAADRVTAQLASERDRLPVILDELDNWRAAAKQATFNAEHLPITRAGALTEAEATAAESIIQMVDEHSEAASRLLDPSTCSSGDCVALHASAKVLSAVHEEARATGISEHIQDAADRVTAQLASERDRLPVILDELDNWRAAAKQATFNAEHLPITRAGALTEAEATAAESILQMVDEHGEAASRLLDPSTCSSGECVALHASAKVLSAVHEEARATGISERIQDAADRVTAQLASERDRLPVILDELDNWRAAAKQATFDAEHLPLTRSGALSEREVAAISAITDVYDGTIGAAKAFGAGALCDAGGCGTLHAPLAALAAFHDSAAVVGSGQVLLGAARRLADQRVSQRAEVSVAIADLDRWLSAATRAAFDAEHLPITRSGALSQIETGAFEAVRDAHDANGDPARLFMGTDRCAAGTCSDLHGPVAQLGAFHKSAKASGHGELIIEAAARLAAQRIAQRERLRYALTELESWSTAATNGLANVDHLPLTRSGALSEVERAAMVTIRDLVNLHGTNASSILEPTRCTAGTCAHAHPSASMLHQLYEDSLSSGTGSRLLAANERVAGQLQTERELVAAFHRSVLDWPDRIQQIRRSREEALENIEARIQRLMKESTPVKISRAPIRLLPLREDSEVLVASLTLLRDASLTGEDEEFLDDAAALAKAVIAATKSGFTAKWKCRDGGRCERAHEVIPGAYEAAEAVEASLTGLTVSVADMPNHLDQLLDPSLRLLDYLPEDHRTAELLPAALTKRSKGKLADIVNAEAAAKDAASAAHEAAETVRASDVANALQAMDLEVLRKAAPQERFRIAPLEAHGLHNVWDVLQYHEKVVKERRKAHDKYARDSRERYGKYGWEAPEFREPNVLASLSGLGHASATAIRQASLRLFEAVREETPVRIQVKRKTKRTENLLESLRAWDVARRFEPTKDEVALARALTTLFKKNSKQPAPDRVLAVVAGDDLEGRPALSDILSDALGRIAPPAGDVDIWTDFLSRPSDYFGMLTELGFVTEDEKKMHGDLPDEIVEAVRAKELKREFLTASLRTYQSFGARFALVQEKVVIGDEMGLGKTVEALAVITHLRATGQAHFLVVCPAAVVSNWIRETAKHSKLGGSRLHGPLWERNYAAKSWVRNGGVAVTTYDLLPWAQDFLDQVDVGCAVFDEAHYIKNPNSKRSLAAAAIIDSLKYAVLMTGTPLENSVQEFRNLIGYIRPDLSEGAPEYLAAAFRKHVAPAYLRRNQEDVLTELPELVEVDEWMGMSDADNRAYREAVQEGHFMLMRRAAMLSDRSLKVERLREIVEEAEANGRRLIVFSYFRDVLSELARLLPGQIFGPLTGSLPAADRQSLVDRFSQAEHGAVLVAQITAGGVGLNIQSASVVVICEPQIKPTMESQAIARAHRMGQTNTVQVHRLLSENSVDERIRDILADKKQLFDEFARDSVIAKQAPDAVDVSEAELARMVVAAERERLFGQGEPTAD